MSRFGKSILELGGNNGSCLSFASSLKSDVAQLQS